MIDHVEKPNSLTDRGEEKENFSLKIDLSRKILSNFNNRSQIYNTQFFFSFLLLGTESEVDFLNFHFSKSRTGKFLLSIDAFQSTGMNKEKERERERKPRVAVHSNRIASEPVSISKPDNFAITVRSFFLPFPFMYVRETCAQKEKGDLSRRSSVLYQGRNYAAPFWYRILGRLGPIETGHPSRRSPPSSTEPKRKSIPWKR